MKMMFVLFVVALISIVFTRSVEAAEKKAEPKLTEKEKAMAAEGLRILDQAEKSKNKKPMPKRLQDKMNSSFPTPEEEAKKKK